MLLLLASRITVTSLSQPGSQLDRSKTILKPVVQPVYEESLYEKEPEPTSVRAMPSTLYTNQDTVSLEPPRPPPPKQNVPRRPPPPVPTTIEAPPVRKNIFFATEEVKSAAPPPRRRSAEKAPPQIA